MVDQLVPRRFVVGENGGPSIRELGDDYRSRHISISGLENVKDHWDVPEGILEDKENLKKLELEWKGDAGDSSQVQELLKRLRPHLQIECIWIRGYSGTEFPNWVGDPSFSNLKEMHLDGCNNLISLPPLGQLPSLEELSINCPELLVINRPEFYGRCQPRKKTFSSLKTLKFRDMKNWEEWNSSWDGAFPVLEELELCDCPKLTHLPEDLPSLKRLRISGCRQLDFNNLLTTSRHLETINIRGSENVEFLSSRTWFFGTHFSSSLTSLTVWGCSELEAFPGGQCSCPSLEELELGDCSELESVHIGLPSLKRLRISGCRQLDFENMLRTSWHLETINIEGSENVEFLSSLTWFFGTLFSFSLTSLTVWGCSELEAFPGGQCSCPSLEELILGDCSELKSVHIGLPRLKRLLISGCHQLDFENLLRTSRHLETIKIRGSENVEFLSRRTWFFGTHFSFSLTSLTVWGCSELEAFPGGQCSCPSLEELRLGDCSELKSVHIGLPCLKRLLISGCCQLDFENLIDMSAALQIIEIRHSEKKCISLASQYHLRKLLYFSSSLEELVLDRCPNLTYVDSDLPSLKRLRITGCGRVEFLTIGVGLSAPNLTSITIGECSKLNTFGRQLDSCPCLRELELSNCPKLEVVPRNLPSLKILRIKGCGQLYLENVLISACATLETLDIQGWEMVELLTNGVGLSAPNLTSINIGECSNLETFGGGLDSCPYLQELKLSYCPKLMSVPRNLPSLKQLRIKGCGELDLENVLISARAALETIDISACAKVTCIPLETFPNLKVLDVRWFSNLESLGPIATTTGTSDPLPSPSLTSLSIRYCSELVSFPRGGLDAPKLESLVLWQCWELKQLPQGMHRLLPSLEELSITSCPEIESLPDGGLPSKLSVLRIKDCSSLENWCKANGILFRHEALNE